VPFGFVFFLRKFADPAFLDRRLDNAFREIVEIQWFFGPALKEGAL
jgi:hypothetical protein